MFKRKKYVDNPYPKFVQPKNHKKRPAFIRYAMRCAAQTDVARNELYYTNPLKNPITGCVLHRKRRLNEHRARALRAVVQAMLYYFNIASMLVMASVEKLSDVCGLSTYSSAGNKSITRASRLITQFMEPMGLISCEKIWDKILGMYIPKIIYLKPLFFMLFDISKIRLKRVRIKQLEWINSQLKKKGEYPITLLEIEKQAKEKHIHSALLFRKSKYIIKKQKNKAKKFLELDEKYAKSYILNNLVKKYSTKELCKLGLTKLKRKVNCEYFRLKKLAQLPVV
ncbi:replication-associated protein repA1 [Buchnera aphidicola]|uniref:Probable replication-associated protein repA1 n=1 Tax=Buchnera aphidicola subsp. Cinara cedri (strain Cc) TaxID=372461 RepID=REPA1_BUCCC|nr:replication-associated protein repA1 [Buchnera aphidicola]Q5WQ00.1 RecName: Full=Probable replication-associated protein repA1 [Buchnera aphidicola BCc]AAR99733.1 replication-associated protein [Buchnera aphidicola BCc]